MRWFIGNVGTPCACLTLLRRGPPEHAWAIHGATRTGTSNNPRSRERSLSLLRTPSALHIADSRPLRSTRIDRNGTGQSRRSSRASALAALGVHGGLDRSPLRVTPHGVPGPDLDQAARRSYRWCSPKTGGISATCPSSSDCSGRGSGQSMPRDMCVRGKRSPRASGSPGGPDEALAMDSARVLNRRWTSRAPGAWSAWANSAVVSRVLHGAMESHHTREFGFSAGWQEGSHPARNGRPNNATLESSFLAKHDEQRPQVCPWHRPFRALAVLRSTPRPRI